MIPSGLSMVHGRLSDVLAPVASVAVKVITEFRPPHRQGAGDVHGKAYDIREGELSEPKRCADAIPVQGKGHLRRRRDVTLYGAAPRRPQRSRYIHGPGAI